MQATPRNWKRKELPERNAVILWTFAHVFVDICFLSHECIPGSKTAASYGDSVHYLKIELFSKMDTPLICLSAVYEDSDASASLRILAVVYLFPLQPSYWVCSGISLQFQFAIL